MIKLIYRAKLRVLETSAVCRRRTLTVVPPVAGEAGGKVGERVWMGMEEFERGLDAFEDFNDLRQRRRTCRERVDLRDGKFGAPPSCDAPSIFVAAERPPRVYAVIRPHLGGLAPQADRDTPPPVLNWGCRIGV